MSPLIRWRVFRVGVIVSALIAASASLATLRAQQPVPVDLTLEEARRVAAESVREAARNGLDVVVAVVDDGGFLKVLERMDGAQLGSVEVAIAKARSAALFRRPTRAFQDGLEAGALGLLRLAGAVPIEGGVPIRRAGGGLVGAIGVSGATPAEDGAVAAAGTEVIQAGGPPGEGSPDGAGAPPGR